MIQETFGGVELLALYGEDERVGLDDELLGVSFRRGFRRFGRGLRRTARFTPHYQTMRAVKSGAKRASMAAMRRGLFRFRGDDGEYYFDGEGDVYMYGDDEDLVYLGDIEELGAFLPGLKKAFRKVGRGFKKVGKVTSGLTTGIARTVGIPESVLKAVAKFDPTRKSTSVKGAVQAITPRRSTPPPPKKKFLFVKPGSMKLDAKNFAIMAGAGAAGIILVKVLSGRRVRAEG